MTKEELLEQLRLLAESDDTEEAHIKADDLLAEYINDSEIKEAYDNIGKWFA